VLAACFALNMFGRGLGDTYVVFVLPLERDYGWTRSQLTSVYSIYLLMHGCTSPFVGLVFDRIGPRWVYTAGLACMCAAFFLAAGLSNLWQFYLFVGGMIGIGVSLTGMVPGSALIARWYRERLSTAIGIAFSAAGVGTIIFVPLTQHLVGAYDWRVAYRVLGSVLLVLVPIVAFVLPWERFYAGHPEPAHDARLKAGEAGWTLRKAAHDRLYWGLCQVFFFTASAMFTVIVQLVAFFVDVGFSPITAASAFGALGLMSALSVMGSGFTSDRFGYRQTITVTFIGTATGMALLFLLTYIASPLLLTLFVPVFGLCMGVRGPIVSSIATRYFAGPSVATIYGTIYASNAVGAAFGSLMGGLLHDLTGGYRAGLAVAMICVVIASTPFWTVPALRNFR
jgi:MFS family permease